MTLELKELLNSPSQLKLVAQYAFQTMDTNNDGHINSE